MPGGRRELAGDQDGPTAIAILDDLHEIAPLASGEAIRSPSSTRRSTLTRCGTVARSGRRRWARSRSANKVPSRRAFCASAQDNHDLPTPHGRMTRRPPTWIAKSARDASIHSAAVKESERRLELGGPAGARLSPSSVCYPEARRMSYCLNVRPACTHEHRHGTVSTRRPASHLNFYAGSG
jgi:hypothetical protein